MSEQELDFDARYRVNGWPAIAVYPVEYKEESREEWVYLGPDGHQDDEDNDDDWEWFVDWITDKSQVYVIMVGDDTRHLVDTSDLIKISEDDYCPGCGQIGCKAYG